MLSMILLVLIFFLSVEAMFWAFSINRHAYWLKLHPEYDRRLAVPFRILSVAGWFTLFLSLTLWVWHVYSFALFKMCTIMPYDYYLKSFMVIWIQLSLIHLWGIVARYCCLHTQFWPILSGIISRFLIRKFKLTDMNSFCNSMKKWNELDSLSEKHRALVFKFADKVIDLIWTKDDLKRYTYINSSKVTKLLLLDSFDIIGLDHKKVADNIRSEGKTYNFDSISLWTDDKVMAERKIVRFIARGIVEDKEIIISVVKSPIFQDGKISGLIGMGRDVTHEVKSMERIELLFKAGEYYKGIKEFYKYKESLLNPDKIITELEDN